MSVALAPSPAAIARRTSPRPATATATASLVPSRQCGHCRDTKPVEEFPAKMGRKSGRSGVCIPCTDRAEADAARNERTLWRACTSKRAYSRFEQAVNVALHANRRRGTALRVYRCPHGDHHHLTKRPAW